MLYIKHSKKIFENVVFKKFIFESYNVRTSRNIKSNIFSLQVCIKIQHEVHFFFFGRHEVHVRKVMKMPNQSPNSQIDTKGQNLSPSTD